MSYKAEVFNVLIASPGDVEEEREIIRDVIYKWNVTQSKSKSIVLMPVMWESHSTSEMGGEPQEIINKQLVSDCDFLIGAFGTRLGTPTKNHESGTVEEIEQFLNSGKLAMLYFSEKDMVRKGFDPEQFEALENFKDSCKSEGLFKTFKTPAEFKELLYDELLQKINHHQMFQGIAPAKSEPSPNIIQLSKGAKNLLKEASKDANGVITNLRSLNNTTIATNGKNLIENNTPREIALWEGALRELLESKLIIARGNKGEMFEVTAQGYEVADKIGGI